MTTSARMLKHCGAFESPFVSGVEELDVLSSYVGGSCRMSDGLQTLCVNSGSLTLHPTDVIRDVLARPGYRFWYNG